MFFLKYCIVGLFNTIVHWIVFFIFSFFLILNNQIQIL